MENEKINKIREEQKDIEEEVPSKGGKKGKERRRGKNLTVIGSAIDLGRQTFVLAAREMVALENGLLTQY